MWPNPEETSDLVTFTEEIFNGKLNFLCNVRYLIFRDQISVRVYLLPCQKSMLQFFYENI